MGSLQRWEGYIITCKNTLLKSSITRIFELINTRVMKTKLTLVMKDEVIYNAKKYAKKKEESLSSLVENYLKVVSGSQDLPKQSKSKAKKTISLIEKYRGIISLPENYDHKKEIGMYLLEKYNKLK